MEQSGLHDQTTFPAQATNPSTAPCSVFWKSSAPVIVLAVIAASIFSIRLTAPPDLLDQDQERPASYVLDVIINGHWLCQKDLFGDITSKPPVWTWLSALTVLVSGKINVFALYLPGAMAGFGTALLIYFFGRRYFGSIAAFLGALGTMLCTAGVKEFGLARTDGVFAFTVTLSALLAHRSWSTGKGWLWLWLAAAVSTLTKGPLGLILAGGGLLAAIWERRSGNALALRGNHVPGILIFVVLTAGWLLLSYAQYGQAVFEKLVGRELQAHAVNDYKHHLPGTLIWQPPLLYLGRGAPWSLFAYYAIWRIWKHPAADIESRRFERFLGCWFLFGLLLFSLAAHQRGDLLWPIMPAAALLAGREIERLIRKIPVVARVAFGIGAISLALGGFAFYYFGPRAHTKVVQQTVSLKRLAENLSSLGPEFPLKHVDDPIAAQFYLKSWQPYIGHERAAELLRGPEPVFLAIKNLKALQPFRTTNDPPIYEVAPKHDEICPVRIISNRPELPIKQQTIR